MRAKPAAPLGEVRSAAPRLRLFSGLCPAATIFYLYQVCFDMIVDKKRGTLFYESVTLS